MDIFFSKITFIFSPVTAPGRTVSNFGMRIWKENNSRLVSSTDVYNNIYLCTSYFSYRSFLVYQLQVYSITTPLDATVHKLTGQI